NVERRRRLARHKSKSDNCLETTTVFFPKYKERTQRFRKRGNEPRHCRNVHGAIRLYLRSSTRVRTRPELKWYAARPALLWNLPLADGASVAIPKFADVKHSGYKPFTFAAGAGRCHPGAAASAPPTMFEPIHPRGILSKGRVNTSHQGTCSKQDFKLAKGMAIDCRTTTDHRGQLASLQPVELHQTAPSQHQHNGLASIKSGLAALRDFDPTYRRYGSFTSFALSRRVRFAPRAELPQRHDLLVVLDLVARSIGSDRLGNEARRQVAVMLLDHAGVAVAEIARHHHQRRAVHHGVRSPRVAQDVEGDHGLDLGALAGLGHRPRLLRRSPRAAVAVSEHPLVPRAACGMLAEEGGALRGEHHVPGLAGLAL